MSKKSDELFVQRDELFSASSEKSKYAYFVMNAHSLSVLILKLNERLNRKDQ
jgi:hypothetical protein